VPLPPFRDLKDPDEKRREIVWIAISFIVILATWLSVVLVFGYQPLIFGMSYDEAVLGAGLFLLVFCTIIYLAAREREQRSTNKTLVAKLQGAVKSLDQRVEQLNGLCSASAELAGCVDLDYVAHCLVESTVSAVDAEAAYLVLIDANTARPTYAYSTPLSGCIEGEASLDPNIRWSEFLSAAEDGPSEFRTLMERRSADRKAILAPFRLADGTIGVVGARRPQDSHAFSEDEHRVLTTLANMAAKAIENARLHAELKENYLATIRSLVNSLNARDNYSASHSTRVAALALSMAEQLGLPDSMLHDIEVFGPLHDVGKIGIRDQILLKPTPLTEQERAICREHCIIGERILRPLRPSREALGMVRNHHEVWDGSGYPDELAGEDIPLLARVLQVADSYDAMISDRPYQPAMSEQEVLAHFRQYAGVFYDPVVVDALCAVAAYASEATDKSKTRERESSSRDAEAPRHSGVNAPGT